MLRDRARLVLPQALEVWANLVLHEVKVGDRQRALQTERRRRRSGADCGFFRGEDRRADEYILRHPQQRNVKAILDVTRPSGVHDGGHCPQFLRGVGSARFSVGAGGRCAACKEKCGALTSVLKGAGTREGVDFADRWWRVSDRSIRGLTRKSAPVLASVDTIERKASPVCKDGAGVSRGL